MMAALTLKVPDFLEENHQDTVNFIAAKLYEAGKLSLGQAAEMVGLDKKVFAESLSKYGVSFINYTAEDILNDVARISKI